MKQNKQELQLISDNVREDLLILEDVIDKWGGTQISKPVDQMKLDLEDKATVYMMEYSVNDVLIKQLGAGKLNQPEGRIYIRVYSKNSIEKVVKKLKELYPLAIESDSCP
jgi:hypothetical protein